MPGKCAAPPAPAMITSNPRPSAAAAYSASNSGVRWAETMRHFVRHAERLEGLRRVFQRAPSRKWCP